MNDDPISEKSKELGRLIEELDSVLVNVPDEDNRVRIWQRLMRAERDLADFWHKQAIVLRERYDREARLSTMYIVKYERLKDKMFITLVLIGLAVLSIAAFLIIAHLSENFQWKLFEDGSYVLTGCLPWMPCID